MFASRYAGSLLVWVVPLTPAARHDAGYWLQLLYSFNVLGVGLVRWRRPRAVFTAFGREQVLEVYLVCMVLSLLQLDAMAQRSAGAMSPGSCEAASQAPLCWTRRRPPPSPG